MDKKEAITLILEAARESKASSFMRYGAAYAKEGYYMEDDSEEWRVQCLYILNNIQSWRGDKAKEVRAFLKEQSKRKVK